MQLSEYLVCVGTWLEVLMRIACEYLPIVLRIPLIHSTEPLSSVIVTIDSCMSPYQQGYST